jgi:glycosyltransferase involved in cell wall biosynthesis
MTSQPRISVGLPVFNGERYLAESLESLRTQTLTQIEVIISDNGSTDSTVDIAEDYCRQDSRFRLIRQPTNRGGAFNHNFVIDEARAPYFKWASHDDVCESAMLEKLVDALEANPQAALAYSDVQYIDAEGKAQNCLRRSLQIDHEHPHRRLRQYFRYYAYPKEANAIIGVIRTDVLRNTSRLGAYPSSDLVLMAELALAGRFVHVPEVLFYRRKHSHQSTVENKSARDIAIWFDPRNQAWQSAYWWPLLNGYRLGIRHSSLNGLAKLRCNGELLKWVWRRRRSLGYECYLGIRDRSQSFRTAS